MLIASGDSRNIAMLILMVCFTALVGCEVVQPVGGDIPVSVQRLTSTKLTDIHRDLSWSFGNSNVVIDYGEQPIPSDFVELLLGDDTTCNCIEANWELVEKDGLLRLSNIIIDGEPVDGKATLQIAPAGQVRVNLGGRQYNMFPGKAKLP